MIYGSLDIRADVPPYALQHWEVGSFHVDSGRFRRVSFKLGKNDMVSPSLDSVEIRRHRSEDVVVGGR